MNATDSITEFFYNIVPGFLFILGLDYLLDFKLLKSITIILDCNHIKNKEVIISLICITLGLFLGFIFQGFTKIIRKKLCLNKTAMEKVKKEDKSSYSIANDFLFKKKLIDEENEEELVRSFYLMHNYLEAKQYGSLSKFFSLRLALWSNLFFTVLLLILIALYKNRLLVILLLFIPILGYSWWLFNEYLRILYDTILKSFVTIINIDNDKNLSPIKYLRRK